MARRAGAARVLGRWQRGGAELGFHRGAVAGFGREGAMDARWVAKLANTAADLHGLRLGKYDKPVIRNRKLLEQLYFGAEPNELVAIRAHSA